MRNVSDKICRENEKHILCVKTISPPPPQIVPFLRGGKKYCRTGQATDDNRAHAHCMLDT